MTNKTAIVALLESVADGFDSGGYQSSGNDPDVFDVAARFRALADVLDTITRADVEALESVTESAEDSTPMRHYDPETDTYSEHPDVTRARAFAKKIAALLPAP